MRSLLEKGADINLADDYNQTALMCASLNGHADVVKVLLDHGANVNVRTKKGFTALSLASDQGHGEVVDLILEQRPHLFICDCQARRSAFR